MKLYTTSEFISNDISFEKNKNKKNLTTKMKLYTTSEFISNDISFEKKYLTTKMKLYTTIEFISNDISYAPKSIIILLYYLNKNKTANCESLAYSIIR